MDRIERLIRLNVEIEGLLRVLAIRDNTNIREMLAEKFSDFSVLFNEYFTEQPADSDAEALTEAFESIAMTDGEAHESKAVEDAETVSSEMYEDNSDAEKLTEEFESMTSAEEKENNPAGQNSTDDSLSVGSPTYGSAVEEMPETQNAIAEEPITEETPIQDAIEGPAQDVDEESARDAATDEPAHGFDMSISDDEIVPVELGEFPEADDIIEQPLPESIDHPQEKLPATEAEADSGSVSESETPTLGDRLSEEMPSEIRVDEMIARRTAGDLTKAFTLNDKIRFRRSLFASNAEDFAKVLSDLSAVSTYSEAIDYLTGTYGWDIANPEVAEFLTIIRPHYPKED